MNNFVVLTAVSSERQVEDRASLDAQLANARTFGERLNWHFNREYRVDGYSRSGYFDLTKAFQNIPPLAELSQTVISRKTDLIVVDSFDRLGSVALAFWEWLKPYRIQLRSVQQATPVFPPEQYEWRQDEITYNQILVSMMNQGYRINKIVRAFAVGNPKRAKDGNYVNRVPHGYTKIDKNTTYPNPALASLFIQIKDWFLAGERMSVIQRNVNNSGVLSQHGNPNWSRSVIEYMLKNTYFAGKTSYGRNIQNEHGHYILKSDVELFDGKHEPLWDYDTYLAIMAEFERRSKLRAMPKDYNLTGLLHCSQCNQILHIANIQWRSGKKVPSWYCPKHVSIELNTANQLLGDELTRLFRDHAYKPLEPEVRSRSHKDLLAVEGQIRRLDAAYLEAGTYTATEYADLRKKLLDRKTKLADHEQQEKEAHRREAERQQLYQTMRELIPNIHAWIIEQNPAIVKFYLSRMVNLTAYPNKTIHAEFI